LRNTLSESAIRQIFFILIILSLGIILLWKLTLFIPSFLGAYSIYIITDGLYQRLLQRYWKPGNASLMILMLVMIAILLPLGLFINYASRELFPLISDSSLLLHTFQQFLHSIENRTGLVIHTDEGLRQIAGFFSENLSSVLGSGVQTLLQVVMTMFIAFFLMKHREEVEDLYDSLPLTEENISRVKYEVRKLVNANAIGIPVVALSQSLTALVGYLLFGVPNPLLWFALSCVATLIPIIGGGLSYLPLVLLLWVQGNTVNALGLLVYGIVVIGTIDNIIRFTLLKKISDIHPLVTVLGVIAGLQLFGFIGIVFGPIMISVFLLAMRIYREEYIR